MGKRVKQWAIRRRRELIEELGGKCVLCGEIEYEKLEFDHIHGKDWSARGKSTDQRICRYIKEAKLNLLQILCKKCNDSKGDPLDMAETERLLTNLPGWMLEDIPERISENCPF